MNLGWRSADGGLGGGALDGRGCRLTQHGTGRLMLKRETKNFGRSGFRLQEAILDAYGNSVATLHPLYVY